MPPDGQWVNVNKSSFVFSSNTTEERKQECNKVLGFSNRAVGSKYLGLPYVIGRSKQNALAYVKDNVLKRIKGWVGQNVNLAGKEVLANSVLLTLPIYIMACVKIPASLCKSLNSAVANFFWNGSDNTRKIHWLRWGKLTEVKGKGGLGFRDLEAFKSLAA